MSVNVGTIDRSLRAVLGLVLLVLPFVSGLALFTATWATAVSVIAGLVMLGTAAMRFCPMYTLFGIRTCRT